jgi:signal peptidase II
MSVAFLRRYGFIASLILLGMVLLFADFATKAYVYHLLSFNDLSMGIRSVEIPIFYDFFGIDFLISLAVNKGAAWGFFADFQMPLLIIRIFVILGIFAYLFFFNHNLRIVPPFVLVLSGAIGNVVDFFLYGSVVDFLHFNLWGYHFPIFNLADTWITLGVAWLLLITLFARKKNILIQD